jgi:hypothetical protein
VVSCAGVSRRNPGGGAAIDLDRRHAPCVVRPIVIEVFEATHATWALVGAHAIGRLILAGGTPADRHERRARYQRRSSSGMRSST